MVDSSSAKASKRGKQERGNSSSKLPQARERQTLWICLALIAAVCAFYCPVIHNGFIRYDDNTYITDNPHVTEGVTWASVEWAFTTYDEANWHPLTWLSHALDCDLFGLNPAGPHCVNVLLHAANAVLLFLLLQSTTGFRWRSLMVAALFALHPINVESVAWAAERKNVLSMMFFLLALYAYAWYTREPGIRRYAAVVGFYTLALMAKPQVITFPFLLLLWDYWPLGRIGAPDKSSSVARRGTLPKSQSGWIVLEKIPFLLLSLASAVLTMQAHQTGGAIKSRYGLLLRLETAVISYARYLGKAFWPSKLVALYPHPTQLYPAWQVGAAALALLLVTALVILRTKEQPYLPVGWFWFLGSLVPMVGLVQAGEQAMADRYAYISFIGLFVIAVWLLADWASAHRVSTRSLAIPAFSCLLLLGILTYRQVGYWHDTESFWLRTLALTENNYVAHEFLGGFLRDHGRIEEAVVQYQAAIAIRPDDLPSNLAIADYERKRGNLAAAIEHCQTVISTSANVSVRVSVYAILGSTYYQMGEPIKAKESFEASLRLSPNQPAVLVKLGLIEEKEGDMPAAIREYSHAMALQPGDVGYLLLSHALQKEGRADEANAMFQRAAHLSSNLPHAQKQAESLLAGK